MTVEHPEQMSERDTPGGSVQPGAPASQPEHSQSPDRLGPNGFRRLFEPATPVPGFARFIETMRRLQDLAIAADSGEQKLWATATSHLQAAIDVLTPSAAPEGLGLASRVHDVAGLGSVLLPPWRITSTVESEVTMAGRFNRFYLGGNNAVHGGAVALLFDWLFGSVAHAGGRPVSRTAFLHVDYRQVTPIDTPLRVQGRITHTEGRKAFVSAELFDGEQILAEAHGLMVALRTGQQ